ncbi:hypothetical protein F5B17DRAFT_419421 [Nemania serpens]|nr:hypothetical protein F5B17DRAFT_419421 [Nemania serpens]
MNGSGSPYASNCELAAATYDVDLDVFASWNPGLGDVSDPACAFEKGVRYRDSWYVEQATQPLPIATTTTSDRTYCTGRNRFQKNKVFSRACQYSVTVSV